MTYCYTHDSGCGCEPTAEYEGTQVALNDVTPQDLRMAADKIEAGELVALHDADQSVLVMLRPRAPRLAEIYMIREKDGSWYADTGEVRWTRYVSEAVVFEDAHGPLPANSEWVKFVEVPF